jgi:hypothetical protein
MCYKTITIMVCLILILLSLSCSDNTEKTRTEKHRDDHSKQNISNHDQSVDEVGNQKVLFMKLTYDKFQNIRNNNDSFREITIQYDYFLKENASGRNDEIRFFSLDGGSRNWDPKYFSSISEYKGSLYHVDDTIHLEEGFSKDFTCSEVEDIYIYMDTYHDYFFNHEEYFGEETVESDTRHMTSYNYIFTLYIFPANAMTNEYDPCWVIEKGIDKYPSPDHILYGLFQMLENDFISQFE